MRHLLLGSLLCATALLGAAGCGGDDDDESCEVGATECDGTQLRTCVDGEFVAEDCATSFSTCQLVSEAAGFACIDACAEAGATAEGTCGPNGILTCAVENGVNTVHVEGCPAGSACEPGVSGGGASCVEGGDPCAGTGPQGACAGDTVTRCTGGALVATDCGDAGQICTYVDDTSGYGCADPATVGANAVHGLVRYEDKPPLDGGALGGLGTQIVRGARITVVEDAGSAVLATGIIADNGTYALNYDAAAGAMVHILVATQSPLAGRPGTVRNEDTGQVFGFGGPSFTAALSATSDVLVSDASRVSEAFNVFDMMILSFDRIRNVLGNPTPTPLDTFWAPGSQNGTYFSGEIHLLGANEDDDGYDDAVILHEIGHFVEATEGRSDSPGGPHGGEPTDPRLAWSEGFATYWAMAARGRPVYADSNAGGGFGYNSDTDVTVASGSGIGQDVGEEMITEILWDIGDIEADGGGADDDNMKASSHNDVLLVQPEYLSSSALRNIGVSGVDLVDFLDGWFMAAGLTSCNEVRDVVTAARHFPYDYNGPAGSCN